MFVLAVQICRRRLEPSEADLHADLAQSRGEHDLSDTGGKTAARSANGHSDHSRCAAAAASTACCTCWRAAR